MCTHCQWPEHHGEAKKNILNSSILCMQVTSEFKCLSIIPWNFVGDNYFVLLVTDCAQSLFQSRVALHLGVLC